MAQSQAIVNVDTRNLEWKDNNVGSKLLQKMGWKDGQGIGKRRMLLNKSESNVSSEGLRVRKRVDGLGLGASSNAAVVHAASVSHVSDFANVLKSLQDEHRSSSLSSSDEDDEGADKKKRRRRDKKKKKRSTSGGTTSTITATTVVVAMPTNKSTHAKVRQAKFQPKTQEDMKCIFAGADVFASLGGSSTGNNTTTTNSGTTNKGNSKKRQRREDKQKKNKNEDQTSKTKKKKTSDV
jgi:hypothetical protein